MTWPRALVLAAALCTTSACETAPTVTAPSSTRAEPEAKTYGQLRAPQGPVTALADIADDPSRYEGQQVQTEGEIRRVCQKRGCWLELADASGARAFVPMAGHAFAVPMDSIGNVALIEGVVRIRERSDAERKHLESDGAGHSIPALSIEANAVVIR